MKWTKAKRRAYNRRYRRGWMRKWRSNDRNRLHELAMAELRDGVREKICTEEAYWQEVWMPSRVTFLERKA